MKQEIHISNTGFLKCSLPFKSQSKPQLPDNKHEVLNRTTRTLSNLKNKPQKLQDSQKFMQKFIDKQHAEPVPREELDFNPKWYIPVFPVYHPRKKKLRLVFDASANFQQTSLNDHLLQGPDQNSSLYGVLCRFRENQVEVTGDIESMFHCFYVNPEDRNFLRFFWWEDNNPVIDIIEYRMRVHLFGNRSSPGVAIHCLHFVADIAEDEDVMNFIKRNFYVDDGLGSFDTVDDAIHIIASTRRALSNYNIRLHKLMSSHAEVLQAFAPTEVAQELQMNTLSDTNVPRVLGVLWDVHSDCFRIRYTPLDIKLTKRGLFSLINSIYDPLGFVAPVLLRGRQVPRQATSKQYIERIKHAPMDPATLISWDDMLPPKMQTEISAWLKHLPEVNKISIPRLIIYPQCLEFQLHIFSDASDIAVGNVFYMTSNENENINVRLIQGETRLHPLHANTIPRLELCAAVAAVTKYQKFASESTRAPTQVVCYTDLMIVLGYINNATRKFLKYVTNRVTYILSHTDAQQWRYVNTKDNPADIATRGATPKTLNNSIWFTGPAVLSQCSLNILHTVTDADTLLPEETKIQTLKITKMQSGILDRFAKFSTWRSLVRAISMLRSFLQYRQPQCSDIPLVLLYSQAETHIIQVTQQEQLIETTRAIENKIALPKDTAQLNPFLDSNGILRVGGRLQHSQLPHPEKHPVIIPKSLISHHSSLMKHTSLFIIKVVI
ncbi:uncharacterized protein LOC134840010 [Symsagittifera roscoffensis]|uniref:uncharacterized protein LOC134840010 n=1 Tax=Symsagittifera roscoffensis TaxID=84072 RepID=UPI00307C1A2B